MLGFNYRMTDIQAALGVSQIKRLARVVEERNHLYSCYQKLIDDLPIKLLEIPENVLSAVHLAVVQLDTDNASFHRSVFKDLRANGIGVQLHYSPVYMHPYYQNIGFKQGHCPHAERYNINAISLPLFPGLTEEQMSRVVQVLNQCLEEHTN